MAATTKIKFSRTSLSRLKPDERPYFVLDKLGSGLRQSTSRAA